MLNLTAVRQVLERAREIQAAVQAAVQVMGVKVVTVQMELTTAPVVVVERVEARLLPATMLLAGRPVQAVLEVMAAQAVTQEWVAQAPQGLPRHFTLSAAAVEAAVMTIIEVEPVVRRAEAQVALTRPVRAMVAAVRYA
jgi:hypothetical protein